MSNKPNNPEIEGRRYSTILSLNLQKLESPSEPSISSYQLDELNLQSPTAKSFLTNLDRYQTKHEYTIGRYTQIREEHRKQEETERFRRKLSLLYKFTFHLISNVINIFSVIVYIIQTFTDNEESEFYSETISTLLSSVEFGFTLFFLAEYLFNLNKKRLRLAKFVFSLDSFIDLITIIPGLISFIYLRDSVSVGYMRIFRVFRVFRVLRIYKSLKVIQIENSDTVSDQEVVYKLDPVKLQFFTILMVIFCTVFIGSGVTLSLQEIFPGSVSHQNMNFVDAFYFMLTSLTTIGYGDILPSSVFMRIILIFTLVAFIAVVSEQFSKLGQLLQVWGNGVYAYSGENHYILVASNTFKTRMFIEMVRISEEKTPILILSQDGEKYQSKEFPFNKVKIMRIDKLDGEILDYANSKFAKGIFLLNEAKTEGYLMQEKKLEYILVKIRYFHGRIKVPVYLENILNSGKESKISQETNMQVNGAVAVELNKIQLLAKSCFIKGFSTLMQNLAFNRYDLPTGIDNFPFISRFYLLGCRSRLRVKKLPLYFVGKEFINCSIAVFYKSISDYVAKISADSLNTAFPVILMGMVEYNIAGEENIKIYPSETKVKRNSLGIFMCNEDNCPLDSVLSSFRDTEPKKKVSFTTLSTENTTNKPTPRRKTAVKQSSKRKMVNLREIVMNDFIEDDSVLEGFDKKFNSIAEIINEKPKETVNKMNLRRLTIKNLNVLVNAEEGDRSELACRIKEINGKHYKTRPNSGSNEEINQYTVENRIVNVEKHDQSNQIRNHFLIVGVQECLEQLIEYLQIHFSESEFCLFSNKSRDDRIVRLLKKHRNLKHFTGNQLNPLSLRKAGIEKCKQVVFLPEKIDSRQNEDIVNILSCRAIDYFYDSKVKINLWDTKNQKLIGYVPLDTDSSLTENEFIHPKFMAGETVLSDQFGKLLATLATSPVEHKAWAALLALGNGVAKEERVGRKLYGVESTVISVDVPRSYSGEEYSVLCHDLFKLEFPAIPLGLYIESPLEYLELLHFGNVRKQTRLATVNELKIKLSHKKKLKYSEEAYKREKPFLDICKKMKKINKFGKIVLDFVDAKQPHLPIFITNPPPSFPLVKGCSVTVLSVKREKIDKRSTRKLIGTRNAAYNKGISQMLKIQEEFNKAHKQVKDSFDAAFRETSTEFISSLN